MSFINGVWHDAKLDPPKDGERVLCLKQLKNGRVDYCFGSRWSDRQWDDGWITGGGNNNVIWWTPLPKMPEGGAKDDET